MGNGKTVETTAESKFQGRRKQVGVVSAGSSPAAQWLSFLSPKERKTCSKGAVASVLDRVVYCTCFVLNQPTFSRVSSLEEHFHITNHSWFWVLSLLHGSELLLLFPEGEINAHHYSGEEVRFPPCSQVCLADVVQSAASAFC